MNSQRKVVVIGLDGATLDLIEPWAAAGYLPHLAGLMARGTTARLQTVLPPLTGPAWTSFITGLNPGRHGIYDFVGFRPNSYTLAPYTSAQRHGPSLWAQLSQAGRRVGVINVPLTYPPEAVNGFLISGLMTPPDATDYAYPPDIAALLRQAVPDYVVQPPGIYFAKGREAALVQAARAMTEQHLQASLHLLRATSWDFFMTVFMATDVIQHAAWHFFDATHREHVDSPLRDAIRDCYRQVDAGIGQILAALDEQTTVLIMSDHGFGPMEDYFHLNTWLWQQGWLRLKTTPRTRLKQLLFRLGMTPVAAYGWLNRLGQTDRVTRQVRQQRQTVRSRLQHLFLSFEDVDWPRTRAYSLGNAGAIWLNRQGREPDGSVAPGAPAETLLNEITQALQALRHPRTGQPIVDQVWRGEEVYHGRQMQRAPDLLFSPLDWRTHAYGQVEFSARRWLEPAFDRTGGHRMEGVCILAGPEVKPGYRLSDCRIIDLCPTILGLLGAPLSAEMDGRFLAEVFTQPFELRWRAASEEEDSADSPDALTAAEALALRQQLKNLGYAA